MSEVNTLKALLVGRVERDEKNGRATLKREDFEATLGDDCTMADIMRAEHKTALYRAAAVGALGDVGIDMLIGDTTRDYIDTEAEYGSQSKISNRVRRTHTVGKGDKKREYYGHSTVVVSNGDEPELLSSIEAIGRRGQDIFGPK